ncbi:MAG TPA: general secretion pathway protein [Lachnospiraceae bacterium]|nr:general secretion pathway protein [Lachnospiraceae bacterium]HCA69694.1 general secretion pathway protein [Lachnospiraceae bacterium]
MYKHFYGLTFNPFDKSAPVKDAFQSRDHLEVQNRLAFLKNTRGIGLITAPPGMGKTFALRCFSDSLNPNLCQMFYTCLSTISVTEFYRQLCTQLGLDAGGRKSLMYGSIQERLRYLLKEKHRTIFVVVDECQYLGTDILRDFKLLMNQDYDSLDCFALVMVGLPHMNAVLEKPVHEALKQRIVVHYNYNGLSADETAEYIYSRIDAAGGARSIIDDAALRAVTGYCQGTPRIINSVMSNALILGAQLKKQCIDSETILAASNSITLG